jgi:hypothetical protein
MITSREVRWARYVPPMGERGIPVGFLWEGQKEIDN